MEAFRDSTLPSMGILRYCPAWSEISLDKPFPSLPMRNAVGSRERKGIVVFLSFQVCRIGVDTFCMHLFQHQCQIRT